MSSVSMHIKPFKQLVKSFLPQESPFSSRYTSALLLDEECVWLGGSEGLCRLRQGKVVETLGADQATVFSLARHSRLGMLVGTQVGLFKVKKGALERMPLPSIGAVISMISTQAGGILAAGHECVLEISPTGQVKDLGRPKGRKIAQVITDAENRPMVATDYGIWFHDGRKWNKVCLKESVGYFLDRDVKALALDGARQLWASDGENLAVLTPAYHWHMIPNEDGLPFSHIRTLAVGPTGEVWIGSGYGAAKLDKGRWSVFMSKRWLPSDDVTDIVVSQDGTAWIATTDGVSRIGAELMSLEQKTDYFENVVKTRHWRYGLVASSCLDKQGDLSSWSQEASDNDGCWTSAYLTAQCFRYAVTKEAEARKNAVAAFKGMCLLESLPPIPGFVARSVFRKGERVVQSGGEWHETPDGKWLWKGDTSSDEMAGDFLAFSVFHDLVANKKEKEIAASLAGRIMDHLMTHDYNLTDVDGKHTTWGVYSPHLLNTPGWEPQKGLNSLEILSHLKTTYHMTGDEKYQKAYLELVHQHHYALNTIDQQFPVPQTVPWDQELAMMVYYPLFRYETDPFLRNIYFQSLEKTWRWIEREHCPFWTFIYGWVTENPIRIHECVQWLRDVPLDLISWDIRNSVRRDIRINPNRDHSGRHVAMDPIRMSERRVSKLDGSPYCLDGGSDGWTEDDGAFYLLCYWTGRYFGFLMEEGQK